MTGTITTLIKKSENRVNSSGRADKGGYGFIRDEQGHDRFFHAHDLVVASAGGFKPAQYTFDQLREGLNVEFDPTVGDGGKGLRAAQVRVTA